MGSISKLTQDEIETALLNLPGWEFADGQIRKTFEVAEYQFGLVLAVAIGRVADSLDHHPDLLIGYRKVTVSLSTHDVGGISEKDFDLALRIEQL